MNSVKPDDKCVLSKYFEKLRRCYGDAYFIRMLRIAIIFANTPAEALEIQEVSWLAEGRALSTREIAFLHNLRPLLIEFRDYRGAVYGMSSRTWVDALNELYPQVLKDIANEWLNDLLEMDTAASYCEQEWFAYLYKASTIAFYLGDCKFNANDAKLLMEKVAYLAVRFQQGFQQHITFRSKRCFDTLFNTYYQQLDKKYDSEMMLNFVAVFNNSSKLYANLHMEKQILIMVDELNLIIKKYQNEIKADFAICWQVLSFYSNMICICGNLYAYKDGEEYYHKFRALYSIVIDKWPEYKADFHKLLDSLHHNAASLMRFDNPSEALCLAEELLPEMRKWKSGYKDLNTGHMVAMCYLSAGKKIEGVKIFKECFERLNKLPEPKNPYENEIYIIITWRYCDCVSEFYDPCHSAMDDLENASIKMDQLLSYLVGIELNGFSDLSRWKPQMVMTAAKIQVRLAEIKCRVVGITSAVNEHIAKAVEIVEKIPTIYDEWDKIGFEYDRLAAMRNFINVGAIYVKAFQADKGIEVLEKALKRFIPENEAEIKEQDLIKKKIDEFKRYAINNKQ